MSSKLIIAIDAMGGDKAPKSIIGGMAQAQARHADVSFLVYGDTKKIKPFLNKRKSLLKITEIIHTEDYVLPNEKPSQTIKRKSTTSMGLAIESVSKGNAIAAVSAGNTGALMAMSLFGLKTLKGIARPAIAAVMPHRKGEFIMLDLGANLECNAQNLSQFAVMGSVFAKKVLGRENPKIGLLNVGEEEVKGRQEVREAASILKNTQLADNFIGYIEGDGLISGVADVVVTDGFTGNVSLKTAEGVAKLCGEYLKQAMSSSIFGKMAYYIARPNFLSLREKLDPRKRNGAMLLGLNGIVVKSHGSTDSLGFASAIDIAIDMAKGSTLESMTRDLAILTDNSS